jgi:hypothetical protein
VEVLNWFHRSEFRKHELSLQFATEQPEIGASLNDLRTDGQIPNARDFKSWQARNEQRR